MTFTVRPVDDELPFGARIDGVTRETLADPGARNELSEAFEESAGC